MYKKLMPIIILILIFLCLCRQLTTIRLESQVIANYDLDIRFETPQTLESATEIPLTDTIEPITTLAVPPTQIQIATQGSASTIPSTSTQFNTPTFTSSPLPKNADLPTSTYVPLNIDVPSPTFIVRDTASPTPAISVSDTDTPTPTYTPSYTPTSTNSAPIAQVSSSDGMTLIYVPAGDFKMGSNYDWPEESPMHSVYLDAFWIDQTEVTNEKYAKCVIDGECDPPDVNTSYSHAKYFDNSKFNHYPIIYVSWDDANKYCAWAGRRIPTEAEWEKAARGVDQRIYPWGNMIDHTYANFDWYIGDTTEVGSYENAKSFYGAYDMAGNVWEWVADWYDPEYYSRSPSANPLGPETGSWRVLRGGSWYYDDAHTIRSAKRGSDMPSNSNNIIGFRCAMSGT